MAEVELRYFSPEQSEVGETGVYDPQKLIQLARLPEFQAWLPGIVEELKDSSITSLFDTYVREQGDMQAFRTMEKLSRVADLLWSNGAYALQGGLFEEYIRERRPDLIPKTYGAGRVIDGHLYRDGSVQYMGQVKLLGSEGSEAWWTYLRQGEIARDRAIRVLRNYGPDVYKKPYAVPERTGTRNSQVNRSFGEIAAIPYRFALEVLPDITDEEVESMFYGMTAQEVHDVATGIVSFL